jgi:hypothetical protein
MPCPSNPHGSIVSIVSIVSKYYFDSNKYPCDAGIVPKNT